MSQQPRLSLEHARTHAEATGTSILMERCQDCREPILPGARHVVVPTGPAAPVHRFHPACAKRQDEELEH